MAGLYIHIPFCRNKCAYCDFYSLAEVSQMQQYVQALLNEWQMRKSEVTESYNTIYIGGGTPSLLPDSLLKKLVEEITCCVKVCNLSEFTIEANPEDIITEKLNFYKSLGINRVSIGVQSFDNEELLRISRRHDAANAVKALEVLSDFGMNYSADLIYGLPGQSLADWERNVDKLLSFNPPHFSSYLLSYEPGTRLYAQMMKGVVMEATEDEAMAMYGLLCEKALQCGYEHYEVSNFAKPGKHAVHNSAYWNYTPYLGLGVSAHSFDGVVRRYNPLNIKKYVSELNENRVLVNEDEENVVNRANDYIITSLRTASGFSSRLFVECFGSRLYAQFMRNVTTLPSGVLLGDDNGFRIPEEKWLTSDAILRELILD